MLQINRIDPELSKHFQASVQTDPPISRQTLKQVRDISIERIEAKPVYGSTLPRVTSISTPDGELDLYIFEPTQTDTTNPCLIWFHGGGFIMGHAKDMWHGPQFAERTRCTVISVGYRLAPEHPFPAGLNDGFAVLNWVHDNASDLGIDPARIAIGGASAGAGLAAGLAIFNRDQGGPKLRFQLLLYPMIDNLHDTSSGRISDHPIWQRADSFAAWEMYLNGTPEQRASSYAAASRATDLTNLPEAFITVGDVDLFVDENADYAKRLTKSEVPCALRIYPGVYHGAEVAGAKTKIGCQMIDDYIAALSAAFT